MKIIRIGKIVLLVAAVWLSLAVTLPALGIVTYSSTNSSIYSTTPTTATVVRPAGVVYNYTVNGTIYAINAKSSSVWGIVGETIYLNVTGNLNHDLSWAVINLSWSSTSPVSPLLLPAHYMHNASVLGKLLSIAKPLTHGWLNNTIATNGSTVVFVLMFFPNPSENGTVTFLSPLVMRTPI